MHGDVGRSATVFRDGKAIEMAAISRCEVLNKRRLPDRNKAPRLLKCRETITERIHKHQPTITPGDVVGHHRSGDMGATAKKSNVISASRLDQRCEIALRWQRPNLVFCGEC